MPERTQRSAATKGASSDGRLSLFRLGARWFARCYSRERGPMPTEYHQSLEGQPSEEEPGLAELAALLVAAALVVVLLVPFWLLAGKLRLWGQGLRRLVDQGR